MIAFKKETLRHTILPSRCRVMVLLNRYIRQFGTYGGAISIYTKRWRYWNSTIHHIIELPASAKVILCFYPPTEPAAHFRQRWRYFVSCLHILLQICPFSPQPHAAGMPGEPWGSPSLQARHGSGRGAGKVRTKEEKRREEKRKGMKGSGFCLLRSSQEERKTTA